MCGHKYTEGPLSVALSLSICRCFDSLVVILLPYTELHYWRTADACLQMTSAHQLQVSQANLPLCQVRAGSPAYLCTTYMRTTAALQPVRE